MPNPTFPKLNREIRTALRWYDNESLRNVNKRACIEEMADCPYVLISPYDRLLPFQFARPTSILVPTAWGIFDSDGNEVEDLAADIPLLIITPFTSYDYITYHGEVLSVQLDEGTYHSRIVSGGVTYYSEDFTVTCPVYGASELPDPAFGGGLFSSAGNPDGIWSVSSWARILSGTTLVAGNPTDPAFAFEGSQVANLGDNLLYTYTSGAWVSSTPGTTTGWWDSKAGVWYRFNAGWQGLVTPTMTVDDDGACWDGTAGPSIEVNIGSIATCQEAVMQFEFTVEGMTTGSLGITVDGYGGLSVTEDGTYTFATYVANGYLWTFTGGGGFDGCITSAFLRCPVSLEECYMKLSWTHCGNVGNTYYGTDLIQNFYLPQTCPRPFPAPQEFFEEEEQEDGTLVSTFQRKAIIWTLHVGFVPWFVVDALTDMALHETKKLNVPIETEAGDFLAQTITNVSVQADHDAEVSDCLRKVTITFEIDNTAVACCDDFEPPCKDDCVDARGFDNETLENDNYYIFRDTPYFSYYTGDAFQPQTLCESGLANIVDALGEILYSVLWNINDGAWEEVAENTLATVVIGPPCTITLRWTVAQGYRAVLQQQNTDDEWIDITEFDLSAEEWAANTAIYEPDEEADWFKKLRVKVYVGECIIGYSEVVEYVCE